MSKSYNITLNRTLIGTSELEKADAPMGVVCGLIEIKGMGNQITGMDNDKYEISMFGISYPFYEEEFPHHVKEYEN